MSEGFEIQAFKDKQCDDDISHAEHDWSDVVDAYCVVLSHCKGVRDWRERALIAEEDADRLGRLMESFHRSRLEYHAKDCGCGTCKALEAHRRAVELRS